MAHDDGIAARMANHYERQIAWVEAALAAFDAMAAMPSDADWEALVAEDARRASELSALDAEYVALRKEWDATRALLPEQRNSVRALASRVKVLGSEYQRKLDTVLARLGDAGTAVRAELGTLRKSRDVLEKFGAGPPPGGGFVDRRA